MQDLQKRLGLRIRSMRQKQSLSQEAFADACGVHRSYMGAVERGEKNLTVASLSKIAHALNVKVGDLFRGL
jgi:transcriptional regulator with XRE-family HTH domain